MTYEPPRDQKKMTVRPAKTQISLGQADLRLHWAHMPLCWFCDEAAHIFFAVAATNKGVILTPKNKRDDVLKGLHANSTSCQRQNGVGTQTPRTASSIQAKPTFRSRYAHTPFGSVMEQSEGPMDTVASNTT